MPLGAVEVYAAGNAVLGLMAFSYIVEEIGMAFPKPFIQSKLLFDHVMFYVLVPNSL